MALGRVSRTIEDYLQLIYYMGLDHMPVIGARLAGRMGVAPPTVTGTLRRMVRDGLVEFRERKEIVLTAAGRSLAEDVVRRHALAERLLTDILGLPWHEAHAEAHSVEHAISARVEERLTEVLGHPHTCPHGNPIPGCPVVLTGVPLHTIVEGEEAVVERITEDAEMDPELLEFLERHAFGPGRRLRVLQAERFNQLLRIETETGTVAMGFAAASKIRVNPLANPQ